MEEIGGSQNSGYIQAIMAKKAGYPDLELTKMNKASKHITQAKVEAFYRYCLVNGIPNNKGLIPNIQQLYGDFLEQRERRQIPDIPVPQVPLPIPAVPEFQPRPRIDYQRIYREEAERRARDGIELASEQEARRAREEAENKDEEIPVRRRRNIPRAMRAPQPEPAQPERPAQPALRNVEPATDIRHLQNGQLVAFCLKDRERLSDDATRGYVGGGLEIYAIYKIIDRKANTYTAKKVRVFRRQQSMPGGLDNKDELKIQLKRDKEDGDYYLHPVFKRGKFFTEDAYMAIEKVSGIPLNFENPEENRSAKKYYN